MIGTLARKRTQLRLPQLLAAALVVALAGAMFAGSSPARAATGDVSNARGWCVEHMDQEGVEYFQVRSGPGNNNNNFPRRTVTLANGMQGFIDCPAAWAGRPVDITPNGTPTPTLTLREPSVEISFPDFPDGVIPAGTENVFFNFKLQNVVRFTSAPNAPATEVISSEQVNGDYSAARHTTTDDTVDGSLIRTDYAVVSGGLLPLTHGRVRARNLDSDGGPNYQGWWRGGERKFDNWIVPAGTAPGEYTASIRITYDLYPNNDGGTLANGGLATVFGSTTITVVDQLPQNLVSAELTPFGAVDIPRTLANEARDGTGVAPAGQNIWLKLESRNALGAYATGSRLTAATALGSGATLRFFSAQGNGAPAMNNHIGDQADNAAQVNNANNVNGLIYLRVGKTDGQAGTVNVRAIVLGDDGQAQTETLTLTFTGPAAVLTLGGDAMVGQPSAAVGQAQVEIALSATDAGGNSVNVPTAAATEPTHVVTDADGNAVSDTMIRAANGTAGASTDATTDDDDSKAIVLVTVTDLAAPGDYTITSSLPGVADSSVTAALTVTGPAASLELSADQMSSSTLGEVIMVTATVNDADGNAVANGAEVTFTTAGSGLVVTGADANTSAMAPGHQARTTDGQATAQFTVVGPGRAVISAAIANQTAVIVVTSTAGQDAPVEEEPAEEISIDCLSGVVGFVTWICGTSASATDIFPELAGRGATALHLYRDARWMRYSVIDGREVPGSTDFTINEHDVLYVSN